jgi:hypothetical protein
MPGQTKLCLLKCLFKHLKCEFIHLFSHFKCLIFIFKCLLFKFSHLNIMLQKRIFMEILKKFINI